MYIVYVVDLFEDDKSVVIHQVHFQGFHKKMHNFATYL